MVAVYEDVFGRHLRLDVEHRRHILSQHPEVRPYLHRIGDVFRSPEWVKRSRRDAHVHLYYRFYADLFGGKYLLAVAKMVPRPHVLTCYVTDTVKQGELLWPRPRP